MFVPTRRDSARNDEHPHSVGSRRRGRHSGRKGASGVNSTDRRRRREHASVVTRTRARARALAAQGREGGGGRGDIEPTAPPPRRPQPPAPRSSSLELSTPLITDPLQRRASPGAEGRGAEGESVWMRREAGSGARSRKRAGPKDGHREAQNRAAPAGPPREREGNARPPAIHRGPRGLRPGGQGERLRPPRPVGQPRLPRRERQRRAENRRVA